MEFIKEFAKWLEQKGYLSTIEYDEDEDSEGFIVYHEYVTSMRAEDVCEEYFKEQKLCSNGKPCKHPKCNKCGTTHFMSECDYGKEQNAR